MNITKKRFCWSTRI